MDYEAGKWLENLELRVQAIEKALTPKKETEKEEQAEPPLGKVKEVKAQERQRKVKRQMEKMKYDDLPDESAVELSKEEEVVTEDGDVVEEEDGIEVLNER